jgi:hypothetical protein
MKKSHLIRAFLSIVVVALGGVLLLKNLDIINISWDIFWGTVWAAGFVLSGLVNIFNYRNKTSWIWGLLLVAIGVDLDLRQAKIKDGSVIEIFTFCGGVNITLPDDVIIENEVRGFLGGTDDKTLPKDSAKKTLYLKGECILGGLEIK